MLAPPRTRSRDKRAVTLVVLALLLVAPVVTAQVVKNPTQGNFEHTYFVTGRVVSQDGWPVDRVDLSVLVTGLKGAQAEPVRVQTDCHGDFGAVFRLGTIVGRNARVTVTLHEDEQTNLSSSKQSQELDSFFRRNDFVFVVDQDWPYGCPGNPTPPRSYWQTRMTVWGRVVDGVGEHVRNETTLEANPVQYWPVNMTLTTDNRTWPPSSVQPTDERGDFKYSWTFRENLTEGEVRVEVMGVEKTIQVDPVTRIAFFKINVGDPPSRSTPGVGGALAMLVFVGVGAVAAFTAPRRK